MVYSFYKDFNLILLLRIIIVVPYNKQNLEAQKINSDVTNGYLIGKRC